jgi:hypothetical protein
MTSETKVRERPILFSSEMVKAILSGAKTQTRRIMKPQPQEFANPPYWRWSNGSKLGPFAVASGDRPSIFGRWVPGERLWVREAWRTDRCYDHLKPSALNPKCPIYYGSKIIAGYHKARPSIHMPRWASRLTLEITDVRVERIQEITAEDAIAEGRSLNHDDPSGYFPETWNKINGPGAWERNDFCWCITFRKLEAPHAV